MAFSDLPLVSRMVLMQEVDEASNLVAAAMRSLHNLRLVDLDHAAVLALLAIGAEKALKLTLGLAALDRGHEWPSISDMKSFRHDLVALDRRALSVYEDRLNQSTAPGYLAQLVPAWTSDSLGQALLAAASAWGSSGRFDRLDHLGGAGVRKSLRDVWLDLEHAPANADPPLDFADPRSEVFEASRAELNRRLLVPLATWWELHTRAWITGVLGDDVKALGRSLALATKPYIALTASD